MEINFKIDHPRINPFKPINPYIVIIGATLSIAILLFAVLGLNNLMQSFIGNIQNMTEYVRSNTFGISTAIVIFTYAFGTLIWLKNKVSK